MNEELKQFCENYEVRVLNDQKRRARYHPPVFFTDPENAAVVRDDIVQYETEYVYTLEIPESRLRALIEMERRFFKWQKHTKGEVDLFDLLLSKEREEASYRHANEAVKKAYEQYSMLLNLAGYQSKI